MLVYINGEYFPKDRAKVSVFDRGFLLGDGIFETVRAYQGKIFKPEEHLSRLFRSADRIKLCLPHTREEFKELFYQVLNKNRLTDAMIRITITRGEGEVGWILPTSSIPTVAILPRPFSGYPPSLYEKGVHIAVIEAQRHTVFGLPPQIKSTNFLNNILVKLQAQEKGAYEGVMLNWNGYATEGATSNLFIVKGGRLVTPSPEAGILEGVTRWAVMELARDHGIPVEEGLLSIEALYQADECFLTSTSIEIMPVVMIDQHALGSGLPGPLTIFLLKMFREAIQQITRG